MTNKISFCEKGDSLSELTHTSDSSDGYCDINEEIIDEE
jgi:hypothetical protein